MQIHKNVNTQIEREVRARSRIRRIQKRFCDRALSFSLCLPLSSLDFLFFFFTFLPILFRLVNIRHRPCDCQSSSVQYCSARDDCFVIFPVRHMRKREGDDANCSVRTSSGVQVGERISRDPAFFPIPREFLAEGTLGNLLFHVGKLGISY